MIEITIKHELNQSDVTNIIITAFEGGIGYWCDSAEPVELTASGWHAMSGETYKKWVKKDTEIGFSLPPYANEEFWSWAFAYWHQNPERGYALHDEYDENWISTHLTLRSLQNGIDAMQRDNQRGKWNETLSRLANEQYDAEDADVLVQFAVFGELVYG